MRLMRRAHRHLLLDVEFLVSGLRARLRDGGGIFGHREAEARRRLEVKFVPIREVRRAEVLGAASPIRRRRRGRELAVMAP